MGTIQESDFYVRYHFTSENIYTDIEIENLKAKITYADKECVGRNAENSEPQISEALWRGCLKTKKTSLSSDDIQGVRALIKQSNFMSLESVYGKKDAGRAYEYEIEVKIGDSENKVTYRSAPSVPPMPQTFEEVQKRLLEIFNRIVQDSSIDSSPA